MLQGLGKTQLRWHNDGIATMLACKSSCKGVPQDFPVVLQEILILPSKFENLLKLYFI